MGKIYLVYIMANRKHGAIYTGVTGNAAGRVWQHRIHAFKGSFTDRYDCDKLVWYEVHVDVQVAITREKRIKDWQQAWKERLIEGNEPGLAGFVGRSGPLTAPHPVVTPAPCKAELRQSLTDPTAQHLKNFVGIGGEASS